MNSKSTLNRLLAAIKLAIVTVLRPFRKLAGRLLQVAEQSELQRLRNETARLSSASVESVTYLGGEVRRLDERLARLEAELAEIRRLLGQESSASPEDHPAAPARPSA